MKKSVEALREEMAKLQAAIERAEREEKELAALPLGERVAVTMHDLMCFHDHNEGCGWLYEMRDGRHDFRGSAHQHWLKRATTVINRLSATGVVDHDQIVDVIKAVVTH